MWLYRVALAAMALLGTWRVAVCQTARCQDTRSLLRQVWAYEDKLIHAGSISNPATQVHGLFPEGQTLEQQLSRCEDAAFAAGKTEDKELFGSERLNLQFMNSAQLLQGGLAANPLPPELPNDLSALANKCTEDVTSVLPKVENNFADPEKLIEMKSQDVLPYWRESTKLLDCAFQAQRAGYKDAAIRAVVAAFSIANAVVLADSKDQASLVKAVESTPASTATAHIGSQSCRATVRDWGFQKTIEWTCF